MKNEFACAHCGSSVRITMYAQLRKDLATPIRCRRCGAVHSHLNGSVDVISPVMMPVTYAVNRGWSPWQFWYTRPITPGAYHCRFTDISIDLTLWWNGRFFQVSETDNRAIQMTTFRSWRGIWA